MVEPKTRHELTLFLNDYFEGQAETKGAEIGILMARFSEMLFGSIPNLHLLCVDSWQNIAHHETIAATAKQVLANYNTEIMHMTSMEAAKLVPDESLDFVYIDANHTYQACLEDLIEWGQKVRPQGIICGDDYYHSRSGLLGVIEAVDEYCQTNNLKLHLTGWHRSAPNKDDRQPQFWIIKE